MGRVGEIDGGGGDRLAERVVIDRTRGVENAGWRRRAKSGGG